MQAGKQKAVLPLIRKFNEHSGRLLDNALYVPGVPYEVHASLIKLEVNLLQSGGGQM